MRRPRRNALTAALASFGTGLMLLASGCGDAESSTPVACLEGPAAYLAALEAAPGEVRLDGGAPISACLIENQGGGELATVGGAMIEAATTLNAEARAEPGGSANLALGYLLGAAERGAETTSGIHADLLRRLAVAARYNPQRQPLAAELLRTYRRGFEAGSADG